MLPSHSWTTFLEAKRKELQRLNGAYKNTLKNANVELIEGFGKVVDGHTVDISGKKYTVSGWACEELSLVRPMQYHGPCSGYLVQLQPH